MLRLTPASRLKAHHRGRSRPLGPNATIVWTHWVDNHKAGGQTPRGRLQYHDRSRYTPHQGAQEMARRRGNN